MDAKAQRIYLIGFMGSGKSTIGPLLSKQLHLPFFDSDIEIANETGCYISDIISFRGLDRFRAIEKETLKKLSSKNTGFVISTGGGVALSDENKRLMKENGIVIWLKITPETVQKRLKGDNTRPLLKGRNKDDVQRLMDLRKPHYEAACHFSIDVDNLLPEEVCRQIITILNTVQ